MLGAPRSLASRLREETKILHAQAEQSGVMRELLRGQLDRHGYCLILRNLHAIYCALETSLSEHAANACVAPIHEARLYRAPSIAADLRTLHGADWADALDTRPAARAYVVRLREIATSRPTLLVAHAYVRYLGDLSGGQMLRAIVRKSFALPEGAGTTFYEFAGEDASVLAERFRRGLAAIDAPKADTDAIVREAKSAFSRHIALFDELASAPHDEQAQRPFRT